MSSLTTPVQRVKTTSNRRDHFDEQPIPSWVVSKVIDFDFHGASTDGKTWLLWDKQVHAEHRVCYHHQAVRLENAKSAESAGAWDIEVSTNAAQVIWHSVKVIRGGETVEDVDAESAQISKRLKNGDGFSAGLFTIHVSFRNLRAGDVIEAIYSTTFLPDFLNDRCSDLVVRPEGVEFGSFGYSVVFVEPRPLTWKASSADIVPVETRENGQTRWTWIFQNTSSPVAEPHSIGWHVSSLWIQISDLADWQVLATGISQSWKLTPGDAALTTMGWEITSGGGEPLDQVTKLINLIQDDFRATPLNQETSRVPASAGEVIRRRFGDSRELAFLTTQLLKKIGIESRLILVNSTLRKELSGFLPSLNLLNHALVEFKVGKETRWIDPSIKFQGGDALNRLRPAYGVGLPVGRESPGLVKAPEGGRIDDTSSLHETILLSSNGVSSMVSVIVRAKGRQADWHREQLAMHGLDAVSSDRLKAFAGRYGDASRVDPLQYRDSREANELVLSESFEVMLNVIPKGDGRVSYIVPTNMAASTLPAPDDGVRRGAFVLPFPMEVAHTVEIRSDGCLKKQSERRGQVGPHLNSVSSFRFLRGVWSMTCTTSTQASIVPAKDIERYRDTLQNIRKDSAWTVTFVAGLARPHRQKGFGSLPPERLRGSVLVEQPAPERERQIKRKTNPGTKITIPFLRSSSYTRDDLTNSRRLHRKTALKPASTWAGILIIFIAACIVLHYRGR